MDQRVKETPYEKVKRIGEKVRLVGDNLRIFKDLCVGKNTQTVEDAGCWKCGHCRVACPILIEGKTFSSTNTKKQYQIKQHLDCDSQFVIYLGTCQKYKGQYVGKSQTPFKKQHSNHKLEIKKKIGSLGNHYGGEGCGYQNLKNQLLIKLK